MVGKPTETDKDVLRRIAAEPTFAKIREAMIRENAKRREVDLSDLTQQSYGAGAPTRSLSTMRATDPSCPAPYGATPAEGGTSPATRQQGARPLNQIASEIALDWPRPGFAAVPYLRALATLASINDHYGADSARMVVAYFLSNATQWRGPTARRIKAELREMLK